MVQKTNICLQKAYSLVFISKPFPRLWSMTRQRRFILLAALHHCVLQWQSMLCMKYFCDRRRDFDRNGLVYIRMKIVDVRMFWGHYFFVWQAFWCLTLFIFAESLAAGALNAARKWKYGATCQKTEWWWEELLKQVLQCSNPFLFLLLIWSLFFLKYLDGV